MMKPWEEHAGPPLVPLPPLPRRAQAARFLPGLGFVALFAAHEALGCVAASLWYHGASIVPLQIGWYCLWEGALLAWFARHRFKTRGTLSAGRLAAFWLVQAAWFSFGLWCYAAAFSRQPFAVEGVGAWLFVAYLLAALCEHAGRAEPPPPRENPYLDELLKRPMSRE